MSTTELAIAASTIWVVVAAILVLFMQAGFAFLEAGLTRMKNVGHIAAKNALVLALAAIVYYLVGFGLAFGDGGNGLVGGSGFVPTVDELLAVGAAPFSWFAAVPAAAAFLFQVAFAAVSLAIVWGAMAERARLWVYFAFGVAFTVIYSVVSHWVWSPDGWLFAKGMQDFAGSTVVHYQGALAGLAGVLLLGPRLGKFVDGRPQPIPGHNMAYTTLGVLILWFGWFGFNAGSTLSVDFGGVGFFAYVALNTVLGAAAGVLGAVATSWVVIKKPDLSMTLNGAIGGLVAITAACAFVAPWAAILIGAVAGAIVVGGSLLVERVGIDDPVGALAAHGMSGVWGTLALGFLTVPELASRLETGGGGLLYGGGLGQLGTQALGLAAVGAFTFTASLLVLWLCKAAVGIRVEPEVEIAGLDVSEHGMWGYPEFYIPVPGGYGSEHGHLGAFPRQETEMTPAPAPAAS
jgi:Amt family ammonium transporter